MTNGEILEKLFPGFEEIQVFSEYILRNGKETLIKVDREFWESEMREAMPEEREGIEQYINSIAESCGDCISRQAAIDAFGLSEKTRKYGGDHSGYNTMMLYEIQDILEDLPPVIPILKAEPCEDAISRQAVDDAIYDYSRACDVDYAQIMKYIDDLPPVTPQESSITWITGADGAKIAFWNVPVWKVIKICEILGEPTGK